MTIVSNDWERLFVLKKQRLSSTVCIIGFGVFTFLLAASQILGISPDYFNYDVFFDLARREGFGALTSSRFEVGFSVFAIELTKIFDQNSIVYGLIVFSAILLKGRTIIYCSSNIRIFLICVIFYLIRFFPLHELTQLRVACAASLILLGSIFLWNGRIVAGVFLCSFSLLFHLSSAAVFPALFFTPSKRSKVISIGFFVFVFTLIFASVITGYLGSYIEILRSYQAEGFSEIRPNPFAIQLLIDWAIIVAALVKWDSLTLIMKRVVLLELIGMAFFYGGLKLGVVAHRMREFYSVFWIFFVADGLRWKATKILSYCFILLSIVFYYYLFFLSGDFFH